MKMCAKGVKSFLLGGIMLEDKEGFFNAKEELDTHIISKYLFAEEKQPHRRKVYKRLVPSIDPIKWMSDRLMRIYGVNGFKIS
jgi:hypothetical protein